MRLLCFALLVVFVFAKDCSLETEKGEKCKEKIKNLYPSQFSVGGEEVNCKANRYSQMDLEEIEDYLADEIVPVVISQDRFYVLDGHHLTQALLQSGWDDVDIELEIVENWNDKSFEEFELSMIERNLFHLYDAGSGPISPTLLPPFSHLDDDMYRTLAWLMREAGNEKRGSELE